VNPSRRAAVSALLAGAFLAAALTGRAQSPPDRAQSAPDRAQSAPGQTAPGSAQAPPAPGQASAFRSGVDLVSLTTTVTDPANRFVVDLGAGDFTIFEDGVGQDIGFFSRTTLPLSVSLLLDSSASMDDKMKTAQRAALGFAAALRPQDQAQVIDFDSRVSVIAPFGASRADLEKAINSTVAGGSTSLYNAIYIALRELKKVQSRTAEDLRRQAIIVLSDGEDTSSLVSYDEVLELAKRSETVIYAIGVRSKDATQVKGYNDADYVLRQLTTQTGGRVFFPAGADELPAIYALISEELSSQYLLGYTSKNPKRDGRWRRIQVRVLRPGATARTKQGYYAPGL
jgi:Ca-activated chloride channel family protein